MDVSKVKMGSSCSSAQKKKNKERHTSHGGYSPIQDRRRSSIRSTDSIPYGKESPPPSRLHSDAAQGAELPPTSAGAKSDSTGGEWSEMSATSPPPTGGSISSSINKDMQTADNVGLPDLQKFPEDIRNLLMGRIEDEIIIPSKEIALFLCAGYYDTEVERSSLIENVFPKLRYHCAEQGYELNVVDLHWGMPGDCLYNHRFRDLCINVMENLKQRRHLLALVFLNDNLGASVPPRVMPQSDFETSMNSVESEEEKQTFKKWYKLDTNTEPTSYILRPITDHIPNINSEKWTDRQEAMNLWRTESRKIVETFKKILGQEQRDKYLSTVFEDEILNIVSDDLQQAKRCIWVQRRFTHLPPQGEGESVAPEESLRRPLNVTDWKRVDRMKRYLEDHLPDTQKLVFYVKWNESGLANHDLPEHVRYLENLCETMREELQKMIDAVIEDDLMEEAHTPYLGIERSLRVELMQQANECKRHNYHFTGREDLLATCKEYLDSKSSTPLILHGPPGCGKTGLIAKLVGKCGEWLPDAAVVARFVNITPESSTQEHLLRSISEQCCALYGEHPSTASESIEKQGSALGFLLEKVSAQRPLVIIIDGLDQVASYSNRDLQWLSKELPNHVKLLLTVRDDTVEFDEIKKLISEESCFVSVEHISVEERISLVKEILKKHQRQLTEQQFQSVKTCLENSPSVNCAQLLGHYCIKWSSDDTRHETLSDSIEDLLIKEISDYVGSNVLAVIFGLLTSAKHGLSDSELLDVLSCNDDVLKRIYGGRKCRIQRVPCLTWNFIRSSLQREFRSKIIGGRILTFCSYGINKVLCEKYVNKNIREKCVYAIKDYYQEKHMGEDTENGKNRYIMEQPILFGNCPNRRKLDELPLFCLTSDDEVKKKFLLDPNWLFLKFQGSDPYQFLEDLTIYKQTLDTVDEEIELMYQLIQLSSYSLRYDGSQFFAQIYGRLMKIMVDNSNCEKYPSIRTLFETSLCPSITSLLPLKACLREPLQNNEVQKDNKVPISLYRIKDDDSHMISLSVERGEITVWNIYEQIPVRTITGVTQPRDIKLINNHKALVLCNRELKVYDLDDGNLIIKLKGVMNQKMPYYGLHDQNYVVALSRNRMYVNMMNLTTGDLETTFKVGEDRFLNSLLVSANGRICVCGDETQKPFPLLVWDLSNRKLVYDLRIPHHEFITRLSAISDDGHYVVSVCRELHDTSPNFIIVYDLQSGTLFKKWKPESNSCSIAISSQGGCIVNGLENTWLLIWDLVTGARRFTLRGHTAPVDQIRMSEAGTRCLTYDSLGRDRSLRLWDVTKGVCVAVFTPDQALICCELSMDGKAVVLGLEGKRDIVTLVVCHNTTADEQISTGHYGKPEHKGKVFCVSQQG